LFNLYLDNEFIAILRTFLRFKFLSAAERGAAITEANWYRRNQELVRRRDSGNGLLGRGVFADDSIFVMKKGHVPQDKTKLVRISRRASGYSVRQKSNSAEVDYD